MRANFKYYLDLISNLIINSNLDEISVESTHVPSFQALSVSGADVTLPSNSGRFLMLDFWSSWCPPCVQEASILASTYLEYADRRVEFVGVAIWDEKMEVTRFVERFGATYPNGVDARGGVAIGYGVRGIPEKFFIDGQGRIVRKFVGPASAEKLRAIIDELLSMEG